MNRGSARAGSLSRLGLEPGKVSVDFALGFGSLFILRALLHRQYCIEVTRGVKFDRNFALVGKEKGDPWTSWRVV